MAKPRKRRQRPEEVSAPAEAEAVTTDKPSQEMALPADEELSPEEVARILQARAQTLAQVPPPSGEGTTVQVVLFTLGDEVYGIEAGYVENIYPLEGLTPIPCTPDFVVGVVNLRGRIFSVVDLRRFMGLPGITTDENTQVIATNVAGLEVALLANDVLSVGPLALDKLGPALPTATHIAAEFTRGVTPELAVLLNLEALMRDRRMIVHEEV
jgi:purine-binding chemotaxis protein CheW